MDNFVAVCIGDGLLFLIVVYCYGSLVLTSFFDLLFHLQGRMALYLQS